MTNFYTQFFVTLIMAYVIGWTLVYQKRYLLLEKPVGTVRVSLLEPPNRPAPALLPYCVMNPQSQSPFAPLDDVEGEGADGGNASFLIHRLPCRYWDAVQTLYPPLETAAMFISTRVQASTESLVNQRNASLPCSDDMLNPDCVYKTTAPEGTFFIADPENFTIMIDHSVYAPRVGIQRDGTSLHGELRDHQGNRIDIDCNKSTECVGAAGRPDILRLGTLLRAANVLDLDAETDFHSSKPNSTYESFRFAGLQLMVFVTYSNTETYNLYDVEYFYEVVRINKTEFKTLQAVTSKNISSRLVYNRHGVRIFFVQTGELGRFDFQTLLLSFVSGLGLLALSTLIVDIIAIRLMPQKLIYRHFKFEETEDMIPENPVSSKIISSGRLPPANTTQSMKDPLLSEPVSSRSQYGSLE
jgi:hypothetical protein